MHFNLSSLVSLILLSGAVVAQTDLVQVLSQLPSCTEQCSLKVLTPAQCQVTNLRNCLCTNVTLERDLALCVLASCDLTDQAVSLTILQNDICVGIPQPSRSAGIIRDIVIIAAVTFPIILLRFISRRLVSRVLWWDDWAIALAAILMVPMTAIPILNATRGFGKHFWDVPPQNTLMLRKLYYISQILYVIVQSLSKFSILLLYLRIFLHKKFRLVTMIAIGWIVCHTIAFALVVSFQCMPVKYVWDTSVSGKCINSQAYVYAFAGLAILEDIFIILLPIPELRALKLDSRKRVALGFMFALGSFGCVTSMIRLKYIISYGTSIDLTFDNVDVIIWSVLETFMAIICACLIGLRPLLVKLIPSSFPTSKAIQSNLTPNLSWRHVMSFKAASKLRNENSAIELQSEDGHGEGQEKVIRVQKTWVTETTTGPSRV